MPATAPQVLRPSSPAGPEEGLNRKDKSYRRYASNVERALSVFDSALQEWADYIAFLGRLLKALQSKPPDTTDIPHKALVAKRLAQCLDSSLPSGVHQKTLEIYTYIFSVLDRDSLSRDLLLYLPGLSPTLSFASLSVKPSLLSLFETFVVQLNPGILRSALKSIILALLPGLEEETSEEFERTFALFNRFRRAVGQDLDTSSASPQFTGDQYFWQSLFLSSITSPSRRQGALAYLTRELPRVEGPTDLSWSINDQDGFEKGALTHLPPEVEAVTSPEPGLLIRCFVAGLHDEQLLIQRGFLDLLVTHLPLHSAVLQQKVSVKDLQLLVAAAASVVARREMSLNRRLWAWFLGPQASMETDEQGPSPPVSPTPGTKTDFTKRSRKMSQSDYFEKFGLNPLISGILSLIADDALTSSEKARPFRICLSLMDRWEIGGLVVPRIFRPAMESIWRYQGVAPSKEAFAEVLRSASVFFDGIESGLIWAELNQIMVNHPSGEQDGESSTKQPLDSTENTKTQSLSELSAENRLDLALFIITKFNIREEEMLSLHIPLATLVLLISIQSWRESPKTLKAFKVAIQLLDLIPLRTLTIDFPERGTRSGEDPSREQLPRDSQHILGDIELFYQNIRNGSEASPPTYTGELTPMLLQHASQIVIRGLSGPVEHLERALSFLDKLTRKSPALDDQDHEEIMSSLFRASKQLTVKGRDTVAFHTIAALVFALELMSNITPSDIWDSDHRVRQILPALLTCLWEYTSPSWPRHSVEAVRCIWRVHAISPDSQLMEASIATLIFQDENGRKHQMIELEGARRFAATWAHSSSSSTLSTDRRTSLGRSIRTLDSKQASNSSDPLLLARPLLLLLDTLSEPKSKVFMFVLSWLQSLSGIEKILDILFFRLDATKYLVQQMPSNDTTGKLSDFLYYLQTILNLVTYSTVNIWPSLASQVNSTSLMKDLPLGKTGSGEGEPRMSNQIYLSQVCMRVLEVARQEPSDIHEDISILRQTSVLLLQQMLSGPPAAVIVEMSLDEPLIEMLSWSVDQADLMLQVPLMELILTFLKKQSAKRDAASNMQRRTSSRETMRSPSQISLSTDRSEKDPSTSEQWAPPQGLLDCLILGISSPNCHPILEHWIRLLEECLPFFTGNAFQTIMPLVDCFSKSIESVFQGLRTVFEGTSSGRPSTGESITIINALLNGLEQVLARAHDRLIQEEGHAAPLRSPEQPQGFFGNMVSGVFAPEAQKSRSASTNNRLTVLLCFKDAVRVSFSMWSWGDVGLGTSPPDTAASASFNYTSLRLRNRTRRILEHLFAAEALECLETLVEFWHGAESSGGLAQSNTVFNLLHALEASRPKNTIPALFNAIYSRTNPNVLDPMRKSTLTSDLSDVSLTMCLLAYTKSMEDDALDEIWTDCMTFLKDVLGNPLPHRQTIPLLLKFTAILGEKIDNTNFGEQRKMRRDIGELFVRLLAATFTIKPLAFPSDLPATPNGEKGTDETRNHHIPDDVVAIIASIMPNLSKVLVDTDRIAAATTTISIQILIPTLRWKTFPRNVTKSTLDILKTMSRIPEASKTWKKDVAEAFFDARFFNAESLKLVQEGWMPVLRQWALSDKDRMPELLSRLSPPTSAGIVFGVGASSARLDADRKTQLNLRRMTLLVMSADNDSFVVNLGGLQEKLVDLMTATVTSSPSFTTRAEIYMVLRALVLKNTSVHLASLWPVVNTELYDALSSLNPTDNHDTLNILCVLQAAKLLDTLLTTSPDDFQMCEWLFITDTIDAVYRPPHWRPVALADGLAESLDMEAGEPQSATVPLANVTHGRKPLLTWDAVKDVPREDLIDKVLRPFLRQLSINSFESTYRMEASDWGACCDDLLHDLFDSSTLV